MGSSPQMPSLSFSVSQEGTMTFLKCHFKDQGSIVEGEAFGDAWFGNAGFMVSIGLYTEGISFTQMFSLTLLCVIR